MTRKVNNFVLIFLKYSKKSSMMCCCSNFQALLPP